MNGYHKFQPTAPILRLAFQREHRRMRPSPSTFLARSGDLRIETLRGLAILAVVAHHASISLTGTLETVGLSPGLVRELAGSQSGLLQAIRMPLFTVLSGWVYALKPYSPDDGSAFWRGKIRRIVVPLFFAASVYYFIALADVGQVTHSHGNSAPVPPSRFFEVWFFYFGHLWFLHALLVIFALVAIIDGFGWMHSVKQWLMWVTAAALLPYIAKISTPFWSLHKVDDLLVFFLVGVGINRFRHLWEKRAIVVAAWIGFVAAMATHVVWKLGGETFDPWPHFVAAGSLAPICLLSLNLVFKPLVWIGGFSYAIYLYHGIGFRLLQPFDSYLGSLPSRFVWFAGLMLFGILLPMVVDYIASQIPYFRTLVVGRASGAVSVRNAPQPGAAP